MRRSLIVGVVIGLSLFALLAFNTQLNRSWTTWTTAPVMSLINANRPTPTDASLAEEPSPDNGIDDLMEEVSLFYRVDIESERRQSIKGNPTETLNNYKNPCWYANLSEAFPYKSNKYQTHKEIYAGGSVYSANDSFRKMSELFADRLRNNEKWRLRCLPYAYLVGITKSGTSDLFENIIKHPDVVPGALKEPMWWNRHSIGRNRKLDVVPFPFSDYVDLYDAAAEKIRRRQIETEGGKKYHPIITIDGTPAYLWDYDGWQMIPGNIGVQEPRYVLAHSLKALVPQAKIIAILRQPTDRLYSQFSMKAPWATPDEFHQSAVAAVKNMKMCLKKRSLRSCVYDVEVVPTEFVTHNTTGHVFLRASLYYVYVADWLSVFPGDQFLVIKAEEYYDNTRKVLAEAYRFLGLRQMGSDFMRQVVGHDVVNNGSKLRGYRPMLAKTRTMLDDFFQPFNEMLAKLLNDTKFLWKT